MYDENVVNTGYINITLPLHQCTDPGLYELTVVSHRKFS